MTNYDEQTKELNDRKIIADLRKCVNMYENGEIAETLDTLIDIVSTIQTWENNL